MPVIENFNDFWLVAGPIFISAALFITAGLLIFLLAKQWEKYLSKK